jgi:phospholipase C
LLLFGLIAEATLGNPEQLMNRMRRLALIASLVLVAIGASAQAKSKDKHSLPPRDTSGVDHIVVVMMENRSFDHLFGWHPTADAANQGLAYPDPDAGGAIVPTQQLSPADYTGCGHPDPDHSWAAGRAQYAGGQMNGFLAGSNDAYAIGYYVAADRPFHAALAAEFTTFDRFFASILAGTYPNRIFSHAAQTDRLDNSLDLSTLPTIWDRLIEKGVSARDYYSDVSFLWLWGAKYLPISATYPQFLADAAAGTLPSVAFVEPRFLDERTGTSGDDHPFADIRTGDAFLAEVFAAVSSGPEWGSTVLIVTYDEWGGFFDHVAPPRAAAPNSVDPDVVDGKALLGFRVPVVIASPFTRGDPSNPKVDSGVYDHTSVLKLIEWRWNLKPLTARDASSDVGNLAFALDLAHPDPTVPSLPRPDPPAIVPCLPAPPSLEVDLASLLALAPFGPVAPAP